VTAAAEPESVGAPVATDVFDVFEEFDTAGEFAGTDEDIVAIHQMKPMTKTITITVTIVFPVFDIFL